MANILDTQPYEPALQADLRPIHEKASCRTKLTYLPSHLPDLQKRLLGAVNGISCSLSSLHNLIIHNYQLSINLHNREVVTSGKGTKQSRNTTHTISKKPLLCSNHALTTLNRAFLHSCSHDSPKWVEKEKMTIFSLFNLKKQGTYLAELVKVKQSGLDKLSKICYAARMAKPRAHSLVACCSPATRRNRNGAEQVTRTVPDTLSAFALLTVLLPNERKVSL